MEEEWSLQSIADDELLHRLADLMSQARRVEADVVAHIAEGDERKLYAREALPSMFAYCVKVLHLSEAEAYLRISAARASRKHPMLLTMLRDGRLHLTAITLLVPHLTRENRDGLLVRATHRSKHQIEELIAEITPRPDVPVVVRKLPERRTSSELPQIQSQGEAPTAELVPDGVAAPAPGAPPAGAVIPSAPRVSPTTLQPLSPGRYKVQFTASAELHQKLERLQALMRSGARDCDLAAVIEQAVTEKLERLEATRFARTSPGKVLAKGDPSGSGSGRHIPPAVRRAVCERDGRQCRYMDEHGRRCPERDRLEFHHRRPFGLGGDHSVENIALICPAHNAYLAECDYGRAAMARHRQPGRGPEPAGIGLRREALT